MTEKQPVHTDTVNISFYKFFNFNSELLSPTRQQLADFCNQNNIKGTIILAEEGFNCIVAGSREAIDGLKSTFIRIFNTEDFDFKESLSKEQPFRRMFVKIKKEIISMGVPEIMPHKQTAPHLSAAELKKWYEDGKEFAILDTRNDYEVRIGSFKNAIDMKLRTFRQFPEKVKEILPQIKDKPIVTFCTGGIRCEKAAALMEAYGAKEVYQLDGGILKYFEETGGAHWDGECFVFDYRVAVDGDLKQTQTVLCYGCQNPVTLAEQKDERYVIYKTCPHCFGKPKEHKEQIAARMKASASTTLYTKTEES